MISLPSRLSSPRGLNLLGLAGLMIVLSACQGESFTQRFESNGGGQEDMTSRLDLHDLASRDLGERDLDERDQTVLVDLGAEDAALDLDSGLPDLSARDLDASTPDAASEMDAAVDMAVEPPDLGPSVGACTPSLGSSGEVTICVDFPSGVRAYTVPFVDGSFGSRAVPAGEALANSGYSPRPGECSPETHDRYWVRAQDGRVYRTWHPPETIDVLTNQPCHFGHEHGDDPRTSPLYQWAGGVPFGYVNEIAHAYGVHRHEDHFGHKVVVQSDYEVAIGNPPGGDDKPFSAAGFRCHWLSKVHQGTHSGDALSHNMHEYQNSIMCDDGAARHPDTGWTTNTGSMHHTESSVKDALFLGATRVV